MKIELNINMSDYINYFYYLSLVISSAFVMMMFMLLFKAKLSINFKSKLDSFANLLDYAVILPNNCFLQKNGSLVKIYSITPKSLMQDEVSLKQLYTALNNAMLKLNGSLCFAIDVKRSIKQSYVPIFEGSNAIAKLLDQKRQKLFFSKKSYNNEFYLTLTHISSVMTRANLNNLMLNSNIKDQKQNVQAYLNNFIEACTAVTQSLSLAFELRELSLVESSNNNFNHEAVDFIKYCISGREQKIILPGGLFYLDAILSSQDFTTGAIAKYNDMYIATVSLDYLPANSYFLMLSSLNQLDCEYRFNQKFYSYDQTINSVLFEHMRRLWQQKTKSILAQIFNIDGRINEYAMQMVNQIDEAKALCDSDMAHFGSYCGTVVLYHSNKEYLITNCQKVVKCLERIGFSPRIETLNNVEAYLGSLPGHYYENIRKPYISSLVFCDFLAIQKYYKGESYCPNPLIGIDKGPLFQAVNQVNENVYINLFEADLGNTLVIGPPGSGKSVLLATITSSFMRYKNSRCFIFDKGFSFYAQALALGFDHFNLSCEYKLFAPLVKINTDEGKNYVVSLLNFMANLLAIKLNKTAKEDLNFCLQLLANQQDKSFNALYQSVNDLQLKDLIYNYISDDNNTFSLFNSYQDLNLQQNSVVFELGSLLQEPQHIYMPVLKHIFYLIEQSLDGNPCLIVLDEAWLVLQNDYFACELLKWFKTLRKYNTSVILATQSLQDLKQKDYFEDILACAKTRIFLPNSDANNASSALSYKLFGLNDKQIKQIAKGCSKQDYFMQKNEKFLDFRLALSKEELKLYSFAGDFNKNKVDELFLQYGNKFFEEIIDGI